jgi:predicted small integral membrane protein
MISWMAWTLPVAIFFSTIGIILVCMTAYVSEIDKLRLFRAAESHGLGGALRFEEGHGDVAEKLFFDSQKETRFIGQENFYLTLFHSVTLQ